MSNILNCCDEIFLFISEFLAEADKDKSYQLIKSKVEYSLTITREKLTQNTRTNNMVEDIIYPIAAFIDELMMSRAWAGKSLWMSNPIQLKMYGDFLAGENFFNKLNELRENPKENIELIELYYLLLELGYQGCYRGDDNIKLEAIKTSIYNQITTYKEPGLTITEAENANNHTYGFFKQAAILKPLKLSALMIIVIFFVGFMWNHYNQAQAKAWLQDEYQSLKKQYVGNSDVFVAH